MRLRLLAAFPNATVLGLDIVPEMVDAARRTITDPRAAFRVADAERFVEGKYDLISANATFQWFTDLPGSLTSFAGMLTPGGTLSFSFFGPETYRELDRALRDVCGEGTGVTSSGFADEATLTECLRAACPRWQCETRTYTQTFPTIKALLESIKFTGTRGTRPVPPVAWTPGRLARLEQAYISRCGEIRASYQVTLCAGQV